ncbi:MAG: hypothetical protein QNJ40_12780 [Xanthomonadales bacterium]|nr:hypothetical protein [Xanthomonadales bacterium]
MPHCLINLTRPVLALPLVIAFAVLAQSSGGDFEITRATIDAGGGTSSGGSFELTGTVAQPDAHPQQSAGGEFVLAGGFWANATDLLFQDGFEELQP